MYTKIYVLNANVFQNEQPNMSLYIDYQLDAPIIIYS